MPTFCQCYNLLCCKTVLINKSSEASLQVKLTNPFLLPPDNVITKSVDSYALRFYVT